MRVLALVPGLYDISPSQRYRIEQWEPLLRERGVEITYEPFEDPELNLLLYQQGKLFCQHNHGVIIVGNILSINNIYFEPGIFISVSYYF